MSNLYDARELFNPLDDMSLSLDMFLDKGRDMARTYPVFGLLTSSFFIEEINSIEGALILLLSLEVDKFSTSMLKMAKFFLIALIYFS